MIQALSKYLRLSLSKGSEIVTVEDEAGKCPQLHRDPADPQSGSVYL